MAHVRPEITNQLNSVAVIKPQFEIVNVIMEAFVPTGIQILTVNAYSLPTDRNAVLPMQRN